MKKDRPVIGFMGYGRAGKDTAGEWLGNNSDLKYIGSSSNVVCPYIAAALGISEEEAWATRHKNREFWKTWCDEFRKNDYARMCRLILERGDIVIGLRDKKEIECCRAEGLVDLFVWIDRPVEVDPTVTFGPDDCDVVIRNYGTLDEFYTKLRRFMNFAGIKLKD